MTNAVDNKIGLYVEKSDEGLHGFDVLKSADFEDKSTYADNAWADGPDGLPGLIKTVADALAPWKAAQTKADSQVLTMARADLAIRLLILNSEGQPDLAGNTLAYAHAYDRQVRQAMTKAKLTEQEQTRLRGRIREARSANQLTLGVAIVHATASNPTLAAKTVKIGDKTVSYSDLGTLQINRDPRVEDVKIPADLRKAVGVSFAAQVDKNGATLENYKTVPEKLGKKVRQATKRTPATPAAAWEQIQADLTAGKLAALASVVEYGYVTSTLSDALLGLPSEAAPDLAEKGDVVDTLEKIHALLGGTIQALKTGDKTPVADHRRIRPTE